MKHETDNLKPPMRYSAAYPTGRELMLEPRYDAPEKLRFEGKVAKGDGEAARKGPRAERAKEDGLAVLSSRGDYTSFTYGDDVIRFRTSPSLVRYEKVLKWDNGYIEVIANYNGREEEEYIDLLPILENLMMDARSFLKPIKKVEVSYA